MPVKKLKPEIFEPRLFELPMNGERLPIQDTTPFYPVYKNRENVLFEGDSIEWLKSLSTETVDLIFADPPYNIKKQIGINSRVKKNILIGQCGG